MYVMYVIMALMAASFVGCLIYFFVNCQPVAAYWNPKSSVTPIRHRAERVIHSKGAKTDIL